MMYLPSLQYAQVQEAPADSHVEAVGSMVAKGVEALHSINGFTAADIERIRQARQLRAKFIDTSLFADPAWDMLLDLFRAHLAQQRICTTSLCYGSGAPVSTALRWLNALEERGLVQRSHDPLDGRRYFVSLTHKGVDAMSAYLAAVREL